MAHPPTAVSLDRIRADAAAAPSNAGHPGPPLGLLWLLIPFILSAAGIAAMIVLTVAGILVQAPLLLPGAAVCGAVYLGVRHRPRPVPVSSTSWEQGRDRFRALAGSYAAHECDPLAVLTLPALSDVSVPSTARFVDAFADAQALDTDAFPGAAHAAEFVRAVDRAERAWSAARDAAERIGDHGLTPDQRLVVQRVRTLLAAGDPGAWARVRAHLLGLDRVGAIHLPRPARAALDSAARRALAA